MKSGTRYFLGFLAVVIILITLFVLILRGGKNKTTLVPVNPRVNLTKLIKSNSEISVTIQGPLVAEEQRQGIRLTITPNSRKVEILKGYENDVDKSETLSNTSAAYDALMRTLENAGFTKDKSNTSGLEEVGLCPDGRHYAYEVKNDGKSLSRLWSNSCNVAGTFAGNGAVIRAQIEKQIPDYNKFTADVQL